MPGSITLSCIKIDNTRFRYTHLAYRVNAKKCNISNIIIHSFESANKVRVLADVICYWKMTSFMALDGVTSIFTFEIRYKYT